MHQCMLLQTQSPVADIAVITYK